MSLVHASCVSVLPDYGVLLRGAPGSGKSGLALRLIERELAALVADDQVELTTTGQDNVVHASAPERLAGLLEVRGLGILTMRHQDSVPLRLIIDLVTPEQVPQIPEPRFTTLNGISLPVLALSADDPAIVEKLVLAARLAGKGKIFSEKTLPDPF